MRHTLTCILLASLVGCGGGESEPTKPSPNSEAAQPPAADPPSTPTPSVAPVAPAAAKAAKAPVQRGPAHDPNLPPEQRVLVVIDGEERIISRETAKAEGYSLVSLRNDWTPFLFNKMRTPGGKLLPNRYRRIFIGLANDEIDGDGLPLPENEYNFLEVFGIPPSIGVLRERTLADEEKACHKEIDYPAIASLDQLTYRKDRSEARHRRWMRATKKKFEDLMAETESADLDELATRKPKLAKEIQKLKDAELELHVLAQIEKRLDCDDHNHPRYKHKPQAFDRGLRLAVRRFQRKHKIYEHTNIKGDTIRIFGQPPRKTNYDDFVRALTERVVEAASILEDGSQHKRREKATWVNAAGETVEVRNLVKEFTDATLQQLNLDSPEKLIEFFKRHPAEDFEWLVAGVKFPEYPEYYSPHMDLFIKIARGTVWYSPPISADGTKLIHQRRPSMPKFAVYTRYKDQEIRLALWKTTIGGWREELAPNGYLYLKYKGSDVGDRVIRNVIAGPTWVPPTSTPLKSLAKRRWVNGKSQGVVNYNEMGPGYLSAYGLVAGYFVRPRGEGKRDIDNGIRAHGSSDYMSILSHQRYSHGCHRLMNHLAVRLYGFMLNHRRHEVRGDQQMAMNRTFLYNEGVYQIRVPSRGFLYELTPPVPVSVNRGAVRGRKRPPRGYIEIPGREYPKEKPGEDKEAESNPDSKASAGTPVEAVAKGAE